MAHLYVSAGIKSSGKTILTVGLSRALVRLGYRVQPFKKGPDYIDPLWAGKAAGVASRNLDYHTHTPAEILGDFVTHASAADIAIVEGNKGLHDGVDTNGENSNAALAKLLRAPVLLVLDTRGTTRGIAPVVLGLQMFDPEVELAGVILNQVGGSRHESKLRAALERYTDVPVLGAVGRDAELEIAERHLGLIPANEMASSEQMVDRIGTRIALDVDLDRVVDQAEHATMPDPPRTGSVGNAVSLPRGRVRIGIARDDAFAFYYAGDLAGLEAAGAELVPFDALRDAHLPDVDGLLIGGGFPERHLEALEANAGLRSEIRSRIAGGLPVYAECGGLMYLARTVEWEGATRSMVGAIPGDVVMHRRPRGRGYTLVRETACFPWAPAASPEHAVVPTHEFHHSSLERIDPDVEFAYDVLRGRGVDGRHDGVIRHNMLASYVHRRDAPGREWTGRFVEFVAARARGTVHRAMRPEAAVDEPASAAGAVSG